MSEGARVVDCSHGRLSGKTRYRRAGSGEPVLLIHGVGLDSSIWQPQIEALRDRYDVIAVDMLGHGGSSLPPSDARLLDYAEQLIALTEALGLGRAHVIGHSMGALVAIEFALLCPHRVRSVVALNAVYCRTAEQRAAVEARAAAIAAKDGSPSVEEPIARWFGNPILPAHREQAAEVRRLLSSADRIGYARSYRLFATSDMAHHGRLPQLAVPALFMTGGHDRNSNPAMSRTMAAAVPDGRSAVLEDAGHMMPLTEADEVNRRLRSFLASAGTAGEAAQTTKGEDTDHASIPH
jgi:pimeloyl-ACP methyl ester carboxylesterase